jgi:hypothetical protein
MPECDAEFEHECKTRGYSQSVDHNNLWYCKNAYFIHIKAVEAVRTQYQKDLQKAIKEVTS